MKPTGHLPILAGLLCLLAGPSLATDLGHALLDGQLKVMPLDVVTLAARELQCRGWSVMEITDEATDHRVEHALTHLGCGALAADVVVLRRKCAQSPQPLRALDTASDIDP